MKTNIRPWEISDLDNLVKYANNWNISKYLTDAFPHPYTEADGKLFIANANKNTPIYIFTIDKEGQAIGAIGVHPQTDIHRKNAELGYWLAEPFWGQGIIGEAVKQIVDYAFNKFEIDRIFARPFGINLASQRVLEKNTFKLEARFEKVLFKNGEYLDEMVYAIRRSDWNK